MPQRPARHRPVGADAAMRAKIERDRVRLATRPSPVARGYDDDWRLVRAAHLAAYPCCSVEGCGRLATDVDHVESINDAPDRRLDPSNLRSFCHPHHSQRTARDQGFAQTGPANSMNAPQRGSRHPTWLGNSLVPLTVVCGPPGAGKSYLVERRAGPKDLVLDLNVIASRLSGLPVYHAPASTLDAALRWRNSHLKLCSIRRSWPHAWLIVSEPKPEWRQWWRDTVKPVRIMVMETTAETCIDRIRRDERRPPLVRRAHEDGVVYWWSEYRRLPTDIILRDGQRPTTGAAIGRGDIDG